MGAAAIVSLSIAIPLLTLIALFEVTALPQFRVGNTHPDLMMLVVGAWSLRRGLEEGAIWAFIGGVVLGLASAGPLPAFMFALIAVSLLLGVDPSTGTGRRQVQSLGDNPASFIVGVILSTIAYHMVLITMLYLMGNPVDWLFAATSVLVPHMLFNLVLFPLVYRALGWLDRRTRSEEVLL